MHRVRIVLALVLLSFIVLLLLVPLAASAPPVRVCGDGQCQDPETCSDCSADCGVCPATTTTAGGGGPAPITVSMEAPEDGQTIKREILTVIVKGYRGTNPETDMVVTATSDLFEEVSLINNFEQRGSGIYGANVTISKDVKKGNYVLLVRGRKESATDEHQILVTLDPTITVDAAVKDSYFKGERIFFEGDVKYFDKSLATNASLEIALFAPGDFFLNLSAYSDENGKFAVSYPISYAEPDGAWDIRITAKDKEGNEGSKLLKTKVSTPEGVVFYTVNILSPFKDAEFKRGSIVPITVEVKDEGKPLEKAKVEFKDLHGDFLPLEEVSPGIYSGEAKLHPPPHDTVWQLSVQALKTVDGVTKAGGNRIPVRILPATLNLVLLQPTNFEFFAGQQITIRARATYADGSAVEKGKVNVKIGNQTVALLEDSQGNYQATYLFSPKDITAKGLELDAEDVDGNSVVVPQKAIVVNPIGKIELAVRLFYYNIVVRYWYLLVLSFLLLALGTYPIWYPYSLNIILKNLTEAETRITEMQKDIQRKYFKQHSISRNDYDKLISKYREQSSSMREKKLKIGKKLAKRSSKKVAKSEQLYARIRILKNIFKSKAASAKKEEPTAVKTMPLKGNLRLETKKPSVNVALQQIKAAKLLQKRYQADEKKISELNGFIHQEAKRGATPKQIIADLAQEGWDAKAVRPYVIAYYR